MNTAQNIALPEKWVQALNLEPRLGHAPAQGRPGGQDPFGPAEGRGPAGRPARRAHGLVADGYVGEQGGPIGLTASQTAERCAQVINQLLAGTHPPMAAIDPNVVKKRSS